MNIKDNRPGSGPFAMVRRDVLTHPVVTGGDAWGRSWRPMNGATYAVWLILLSHVGGRRDGWGVSLARLQSDTGLSASSVKRAIRELLQRRLLRKVTQSLPGGGQGSNRWYVQDPPPPTYGQLAEGGPDLAPGPGPDLAPGPGSDLAPFGDVPSETKTGNNPPGPPTGGAYDKEERISFLFLRFSELGFEAKKRDVDHGETWNYRIWVECMEDPRLITMYLRNPGGWNGICPPWGVTRLREVAAAAQKALVVVAQLPLL